MGELNMCNKPCVLCTELYCPWKRRYDAEARADIDERLGNFTEYTTVRDLIDNLHE